MQNKSAVPLHRSPKVDRQAGQRLIVQRDLDLLEQGRERHVDWPIDYDTQRSLLIVLTNVGQRAGEVRVRHIRHGDQKVMCQVHGLHRTGLQNRA